MMNTLVIAEHDNVELKRSTLHAIKAASQLTTNVDVLVAGNNPTEVTESASYITGVSKVLIANDPAYSHGLAENVAPLIAKLSENYEYIIACATTFGKNVMPRAAALIDVAQISEISQIVSENTFIRPTYAGNALATVETNDSPKVITVRATAFDAAETGTESMPIESVESLGDQGLSSFKRHDLSVSERPELTSAGIVISGGRGMQSGENFPLIEAIADRIGAAVGASRAAVDAGYVPNDYQVGQTGKVVAPNLYIAVGISGAIQHLAGMKDSKVIAAINKDEEAPIFQIADYGLVDDLFNALPELAEELDKQGISKN